MSSNSSLWVYRTTKRQISEPGPVCQPEGLRLNVGYSSLILITFFFIWLSFLFVRYPLFYQSIWLCCSYLPFLFYPTLCCDFVNFPQTTTTFFTSLLIPMRFTNQLLNNSSCFYVCHFTSPYDIPCQIAIP